MPMCITPPSLVTTPACCLTPGHLQSCLCSFSPRGVSLPLNALLLLPENLKHMLSFCQCKMEEQHHSFSLFCLLQKDSPCGALQGRVKDTIHRAPEASPFNAFNLFGNAKQKLPRDVGIVGALFVVSMLVFYVFLCCWVSAEMYSAPSIVLQSRTPQGGVHVFDDFREAYGWLRHNTDEEAKVIACMATTKVPFSLPSPSSSNPPPSPPPQPPPPPHPPCCAGFCFLISVLLVTCP